MLLLVAARDFRGRRETAVVLYTNRIGECIPTIAFHDLVSKLFGISIVDDQGYDMVPMILFVIGSDPFESIL